MVNYFQNLYTNATEIVCTIWKTGLFTSYEWQKFSATAYFGIYKWTRNRLEWRFSSIWVFCFFFMNDHQISVYYKNNSDVHQNMGMRNWKNRFYVGKSNQKCFWYNSIVLFVCKKSVLVWFLQGNGISILPIDSRPYTYTGPRIVHTLAIPNYFV